MNDNAAQNPTDPTTPESGPPSGGHTPSGRRANQPGEGGGVWRRIPARSIGGVSAALLILAVGHLSGDEAGAPTAVASSAPKRVRVETVLEAGQSPGIWFPGVARAQRRSKLSFALSGRLAWRGPSLGARVAAGAVLARLDARKQGLAIDVARAARAEAAVRKAEAARDRDRVARLVADGAATTEELESLAAVVDAATAVVEAATARLGDAERQQDETVLRAPYAGTVTAIFAEPGEYRGTGQPVLELSGDGAVEVELAVPESLVVGLAPGTQVAVRRTAHAEGSGSGRILTISSAGGGARALFPVLVALAEDTLAGTSVEVSLRPEKRSFGGASPPETASSVPASNGASTTVVVPIDAVVDPSGRQPVVFRVRAGDGSRSDDADAVRVERVAIAIGVLVDGWITVRGTLAPGDRVVVAGQRGLLHDDVVELVP